MIKYYLYVDFKKIAVIIFCLFTFTGCSTVPVADSRINEERRLYRRFPCQVEGEYRIIKLFYATDRQTEEVKGELYFTSQLSNGMAKGELEARINPDLKISRMVPSEVKRKGTVGVLKVKKYDDEEFINKLIEAIRNSPSQSLLVLVFGYKDNFELTATKAAYFAYLLDANTPVLFFDWPGDQPGLLRGYKEAHQFAIDSGPFLGQLLADIILKVKPKKLWLGSSSLGCQVVCSAFEEMYKHPELSDSEAEISHVIMAAPDVSKDEFDREFKDEICALSDRFTAYVSSKDRALFMAKIIDWEEKLGLQQVKLDKEEQFEEAKDLLYVKSLAPDKISLIDVTPINKAGGGHTYYIESPEFYDDFYMRLFEGFDGKNRRLYLVHEKEDIDYWIMRGE